MRPLPAMMLLALGLLAAAADPGAGQGAAAVDRLLPDDEVRDGIDPQQRARIEAAVAADRMRRPVGPTSHPFLYTFFPQAGVLGRDLFIRSFTDLNPSPNLIRDWDCSDYTYDGHRGHDASIRSFREQAIGVPVFAAHDGVVVSAHDGEYDENVEWSDTALANYVAIDHGGGYETWSFHLKRNSVAVRPGQSVVAGQQIGLTGSSGRSSWPHLHLETHLNGGWVEPSAGPCRSGDSLWADQPPVVRKLYVADFYLTRERLPLDRTAVIHDLWTRTASFVKGRQRVDARVDVHNLPGGASHRLRIVDPRGRVALNQLGRYENRGHVHSAVTLFSFSLDLSIVGTWRFQLDFDGTRVVDAPFRVVALAAQATNRPPGTIGVRISPAPTLAGEAATCEVLTSFVRDDPDYDLVSYRYEWRAGTQLVRALTSAASTDMLAADLVRPGKLSCRVTPTDGRLAGPSALTWTVVGAESEVRASRAIAGGGVEWLRKDPTPHGHEE